MKKTNWLLVILVAFLPITFSASCKSKKKETTPQERVEPPPVEITPDASLQQSVSSVLAAYPGVTAEVKDGVVTLRGNVTQAELQDLIRKVQELKPRKVENQLVIK